MIKSPHEIAEQERQRRAHDEVEDKMSEKTVERVLTTPDVVDKRSLFERFMALPREQRFMIGDGVVVKMSAVAGEVRSVFLTKDGHVKYVIELEEWPIDDSPFQVCAPNQLKIRILTK